MSLIDPDNNKVPFGLVPCNSDDAGQGFVFDSNTGRIQLQSSPNMCVVVGESSRSAGPFMSRNLLLANCENAEAELSVCVYQSDN